MQNTISTKSIHFIIFAHETDHTSNKEHLHHFCAARFTSDIKRIHSSPPSHISLQININFPSQYLQIISNTFQEDNPIPAYVMPLRGDENSFQYKSDTCEYIIEAAVGREKKKAARYVIEWNQNIEKSVTVSGQCAENGKEQIEESWKYEEEEDIEITQTYVNYIY